MKSFFFGLLLFALSPATARAESGAKPRLLKPKYQATEEVETPPRGQWRVKRLEFLAITPLVRTDVRDRRFSTFGPQILVSFPLTEWDNGMVLAAQTGLSLPVSRLSLTATNTFTHIYIDVPVLLQAVIPFGTNRSVAAELFAGFFFRAQEYDSRDTADGGLHSVSGSAFLPEVGVGLLWKVSSAMALRLRTSYLWLSGGVSFDF